MECSSTSPNWEDLHGDVLGLILEKLLFLSDYISFSGVCKAWNSIALFHKENRMRIKHQPPWLLMSYDTDKYGAYERRLYNFMSGEICKFKLQFPDPNEGECSFGYSCRGWVFVEKTVDNSKTMVLDPLSGKFFDLPPFDRSKISEDNGTLIGRLSRDPCSGSFEAFVCSDVYCAYIKFGDEYWTYSKQIDEGDPIIDVAFFQDRRMLGLTFDCTIMSIDIIINQDIDDDDDDDDDDSGSLSSRYLKISEIAPVFEVPLCDHKGYLVKAMNGDLLLVYRYHYWEGWDLKTYEIYKLVDSINGELERIPVKTLGSECLFLKFMESGISILASNYPGYKPNTIYNIVYVDGKDQIEVFSLEDGSFTRNCFHAYTKNSDSLWMLPTMKL